MFAQQLQLAQLQAAQMQAMQAAAMQMQLNPAAQMQAATAGVAGQQPFAAPQMQLGQNYAAASSNGGFAPADTTGIFAGQGNREPDWYCAGCADRQFGKNSTCRNCAGPREQGVQDIVDVPNVIDKFLTGRNVEPDVEQRFREQPIDLQKLVMEKGSLFSARDPSAVLSQRMNQFNCLKKGGIPLGNKGKGKAIPTLPGSNQVDPGARPGDWHCPVCFDLQFARNTACRVCGANRPEIALAQPQLPDVETFLANFDIGEDRRAMFLGLDPEIQALVIAKAVGAGAAQPVVAPIAGAIAPLAGDWYCSKCHDLQFARNDKCRCCGAARAEADAGVEGGTPTAPDAEAFLAGFEVDPIQKERFLTLGEPLQAAIIAKGTLQWARDPTSVLVSRMKSLGIPPTEQMLAMSRAKGHPDKGGGKGKAEDWGPYAGASGGGAIAARMAGGAGGGGKGMQPGDWNCPGCGDHQFARNTECRKCQTPNPGGGGASFGGANNPNAGSGSFQDGLGGALVSAVAASFTPTVVGGGGGKGAMPDWAQAAYQQGLASFGGAGAAAGGSW